METHPVSPTPLLPRTAKPVLSKILVILLSVLIGIVPPPQSIGAMDAFGTISIYFASYFHRFSPDNYFVQTCFFAVHPSMCVTEGITIGATVLCYKKLGFRVTMLACGTLYGVPFVSMAWVQDPNVFAALFGIVIGIGSGGPLYVCTLEAWYHFAPSSKGKVLGCLSASYGLGPAVFSPLFTFLCNPNNEKPSLTVGYGETHYYLFEGEVAGRVKWVAFWCGIAFLTCFAATAALFPGRPKGGKVAGDGDGQQRSEGALSEQREPLSSVFRTWAFWRFFLNMFSSFTYGLYLINVYKNYGLSKYKNDQFLSTVAATGAILGTLSRGLYSALMDHFSFRVVFGAVMTLQLVVSVSIPFVLGESLWLYSVCVVFSIMTVAGIFPIFIMETAHVYGTK